MTVATVGRAACAAVLLAMTAAAQNAPSPQSDLTITTRDTFDLAGSTVLSEILYIKGNWNRLDRISETPGRARSILTTINQCDRRRTITLFEEAKTYHSETIEDTAQIEARLRRAVGRHALPPATGPEVVITLDSVDMGERRQVGPYVARHVVSTETTAPSAGVSMRPSRTIEDGWYIDLSLNCHDTAAEGYFLTGYALRPGEAPARIRYERLGNARRGYAIELVRHDESEHGVVTATRTLINVSHEPVDPAIFSIPADYRPALPLPAGGFDVLRPDTAMNRIASYWEALAAWADRWLR